MQTPPTQRLFLLFGVPHHRALHSSLVSIIQGQEFKCFLWSQWTHDTHKFSASNLALVILYITWPCFFFVFNSFVISATCQFTPQVSWKITQGLRRSLTQLKKTSASTLRKKKKGEFVVLFNELLWQTLLALIGYSRFFLTWTKDEFSTVNFSCQLQEHCWPSKSAEDRDWASAAVVGEVKGQAPEGLP